MRRRTLGAALLGGGVVAAIGGTVGISQAATTPAATGAIWSGDTTRGTNVFEGLERAPGTITVANDPLGQFGACYRYETWQNADGSKARCESRGMRLPSGSVYYLDDTKLGQTYYLGWRALWDPMPIQSGAWIALFQLHLDATKPGDPGAGPFVLRTLGDGQLHFQLVTPTGDSSHIWNAPLSLNRWNSFVIGFKLSRTATGSGAGWVSFWYNGVQQTFVNGTQQMPAATLMGGHVNTKWGVYRSGANHTGNAVAYLNNARLANDYADAAPGATGGPSPTVAPTTKGPSPTTAPTTKAPSPTPTSTGAYPAWVTNHAYAAGDRVSYAGHNYQCLQAHTSQAGWEPPNVPALWKLLS